MIYLDYSANTPVDPRVLEVYCRTEQNFIGNPNSTHCAGQTARQEMNRVTGLIAAQLGVLPEEIIYTSGATEAKPCLKRHGPRGPACGAAYHLHPAGAFQRGGNIDGLAAAGVRDRSAEHWPGWQN